MAAYIDWVFYNKTYLGNTLDESEFGGYAFRASAMIDLLTFDRTAAIVADGTETDTIEKIKFATCAVADKMKKLDTGDRDISSESVGGHSVSYVTSENAKASTIQKLAMAAKTFLASTTLMYRGLNADERRSDVV